MRRLNDAVRCAGYVIAPDDFRRAQRVLRETGADPTADLREQITPQPNSAQDALFGRTAADEEFRLVASYPKEMRMRLHVRTVTAAAAAADGDGDYGRRRDDDGFELVGRAGFFFNDNAEIKRLGFTFDGDEKAWALKRRNLRDGTTFQVRACVGPSAATS